MAGTGLVECFITRGLQDACLAQLVQRNGRVRAALCFTARYRLVRHRLVRHRLWRVNCSGRLRLGRGFVWKLLQECLGGGLFNSLQLGRVVPGRDKILANIQG